MIRGSSNVMFAEPDWVIVGIHTGGEDPAVAYMVLASDTLTEVELAAFYETVAYNDGMLLRHLPGERHFKLRGSMWTVHVVYGANYAECLHTLLRDWEPKTGPMTELAPMPRELERGG